MTNNSLQKKIAHLKANNLYRSLKTFDNKNEVYIKRDGKKYISFCSNDYLGLSQNKDVKNAAINAIKNYGFGSGSSRYITGNNSLYSKLENKLSQIKNSEDAIVFGSGYLTGTSIVAALCKKNDLIIADKLIHSCLIDGALLSGSKMLRFKHNDIKHAREILSKNRKNYQKCLIITETVFSMDGDLGRVKELLELALEFNCLLISDDAHGIGIIKNNYDKKYKNIHIQMGTLSKAVGGYGGYVCAEYSLIEYLRNFAKSAIYSTALPPAILAGNLKSLEIIEKDQELTKKALDNANYFCKIVNLPKTDSCIIVLIVGEAKKAVQLANNIAKKGYLTSAIRPPTVEKGRSRLRITFNANHKKPDIKKLANLIKVLI